MCNVDNITADILFGFISVSLPVGRHSASDLLPVYKKYDKTVSEGFEGRFTLTMMHSIEPSSKVTPPGGHGRQLPFCTRLNVFAGHGLGMPLMHSNPKIIRLS